MSPGRRKRLCRFASIRVAPRFLLLLPVLVLPLWPAASAAEPSPELAAALALYQEKDYEGARLELEKLGAADPANGEIAHQLGLVAKRQRRLDDAVQWHEKAVELAPNHVPYLLGLADALGAKARTASLFGKIPWAKRCCAALERAVGLEPRNFMARSALIDFCREAPDLVGGGLPRAYAEARKFRELELVRGTQLLVVLYQSERKFAEAFAVCDEALAQHPDDYTLLYTLGRTASLSGQQVPRGVEALKKCLTLSPPDDMPGHASAWYRLGTLYEKQNDNAQARSAYESAVKLDGALTEAADALARLR
jgi:cytochrome c-type biogenesis protein CcmH/NrfG